MATKRSKSLTEKRSISAPRSLWQETEKKLRDRVPAVPLSRHLQELMARDLHMANGNGKEVAHA